MDRFGLLIQELSEEMGLELIADGHGCSALIVENRLFVQIELDAPNERILICAPIAEVPAGKYRETLLKECLKHHALPPPLYGTFGYLERKNRLVMFDFLSLHELTGSKLFDYFNHFIPKALNWAQAISSGGRLPSGVEERGDLPRSPFESLNRS